MSTTAVIEPPPSLDGDWVIDASIGLKLFIDDPLSDTVHKLFAHLADDPPARLCVPDLFYIEIANVLWKYVRWQGLSASDAGDHLKALGRLTLHSTPTSELMDKALTAAFVHQITAYEASYLALAQSLGPFQDKKYTLEGNLCLEWLEALPTLVKLIFCESLDMRVLTADAEVARAVAEIGRAMLLESCRIN